jgi:hypothetical protein
VVHFIDVAIVFNLCSPTESPFSVAMAGFGFCTVACRSWSRRSHNLWLHRLLVVREGDREERENSFHALVLE